VLWKFILQDVGIGLATGVIVALVACWLFPRGIETLGGDIPHHQRALFGLGVAFITYGFTVLPPHGNGLIAVYVAAITIGVRRPDRPETRAPSTTTQPRTSRATSKSWAETAATSIGGLRCAPRG
jgi:NhaP-type Na+/H+ and K+/H+ antiporter